MPAIATSPAFTTSILARLPLAMLTIGVLVHVQQRTGSYAAAGLVSGTLAVAQGAGGPTLGRLVDRRGQTAVLLAGALVAGLGLAIIAALPAGAPLTALLALAAVIGFATPPVGPCMRALLPAMAADPDDQRKAYAVDSAAVELTWVSGPPLVLLAGTLLSTGAALMVAGAIMTVSTALFAATKASRGWRPEPVAEPQAGGALRSPGVRTLVLVLGSAGLLFGATEVAVTAAAEQLGGTAAAGPLLGLWGVGSLIGGIAVARAGGGARTGAGLAALLGALAATPPRPVGRDRLAARARRRDRARRLDDRPDLRQRLRDGRRRRPRRHHHRGVRLAGDRDRDRHLGRRRRRRVRRRRLRPRPDLRARRRRRRDRRRRLRPAGRHRHLPRPRDRVKEPPGHHGHPAGC